MCDSGTIVGCAGVPITDPVFISCRDFSERHNLNSEGYEGTTGLGGAGKREKENILCDVRQLRNGMSCRMGTHYGRALSQFW